LVLKRKRGGIYLGWEILAKNTAYWTMGSTLKEKKGKEWPIEVSINLGARTNSKTRDPQEGHCIAHVCS